jgi:hypothetical protein
VLSLTVTAIAFRRIFNAYVRRALAEGNAVLRRHVACRLAGAEDSSSGRGIGVASKECVLRVSGIGNWWAVVVVCGAICIVALRAGLRVRHESRREVWKREDAYQVLSDGTTTWLKSVGVMQPGSFWILPWTGSHGQIGLVSGQKVAKSVRSEGTRGGHCSTTLNYVSHMILNMEYYSYPDGFPSAH